MKVFDALLEQTEEQKVAVIIANNETTLLLKVSGLYRLEDLSDMERQITERLGIKTIILNGNIEPIAIVQGKNNIEYR